MSMRVEDDAASPGTTGKKPKKKTNEANDSREVRNLKDALHTTMEDSSKLNKEDNKNKMDKKKDGVCSVEIDYIYQKENDEKKKRKKKRLEATEEDASKNETRTEGEERTSQTNADEDAGYNGGLKGEKDEKKKRKKRKLEAFEEKDVSKNEICAEGEEKRTLLTDADEDAGFNNGGLKGEKDEKKRPKKSRKKYGSDSDKNKTENEVVEGHKSSDDVYQKEKDEKKKRKKRKLEASEEKDVSKNEICTEGELKKTLLTDGDEDVRYNGGFKAKVDEKKGLKKGRKKDENGIVLSSAEIHPDDSNRESGVVEGQRRSVKEDISEFENGEEGFRKRKKKGVMDEEDGIRTEKVEKKEKKREKTKGDNDLGTGLHESVVGETGNKSTIINNESSYLTALDKDTRNGNDGKSKKLKSDENGPEEPKTKGKMKKVRFSGHVEIFPSSEDRSSGKERNQDKDLVRAKRFSPEEDQMVLSCAEIHSDNSNRENGVVEGQRSSEKEDISEFENGDEWFRKRKKKGKMEEENGIRTEKVEKRKKKKKREKTKGVNDLGNGVHENVVGEMGSESTITNNESSDLRTLDEDRSNGNKSKRKKLKSVENCPEEPKSKGKTKKVRFSGHVETFPSSDDQSSRKERNQDKDLVRGKRFSPEEDQMVIEAVLNYIEQHGLGEEGLNMVLHCGSYREVRNCWKEIALVLPNRPCLAIYHRAHVLFERGEKREWTSEEIELVRKLYAEHGPEWKKMGETLGKHRFHVKDVWRRIIKFPNLKNGHWSQEEYQGLFDSVNLDLRMKAFEEKKSKHGMLRDNICWTAISEKLSTRTDATCCVKWYQQLRSSMVAKGEWADTDDYHLLIALFSLDSCCIEDVDWDNLLEHKSGDVCRKRWNQMVRHIGQYANKSFAEQVDILSNRYCADMLEPREVWDSKPVVP